jgi:uncharacterized protein (DUF1778 family)
MSMERTPPLTPAGAREILEELSRPPADTPERRATLQRVRRWRERRHQLSILDEELVTGE